MFPVLPVRSVSARATSKNAPQTNGTVAAIPAARISSRYDKAAILEKLATTIQDVRSSAACSSSCQCHALTLENADVKQLCRILDGIFSFGLKSSGSSYWPVAREFMSKSQIQALETTWQPKSSRSRALCWMYQSLNDGITEFNVSNFARNIDTVRKYYKAIALVAEVETLESITIFLRGLENVSFAILSKNRADNGVDKGPTTDVVCPQSRRNSKSREVQSSNAPSENVTVSAPRRSQRQRISSTSSVNIADSFETSVADFSSCPNVIGIATQEHQDRLIADAELACDASEFPYPLPLSRRLWRSDARHVQKRSRRVAALSPANPSPQVATIDENRSLDNFSDSFSQSSFSLANGTNAAGRSKPQLAANLNLDPDAMLKEILARPRPMPDGAEHSILASSSTSSSRTIIAEQQRLENPISENGTERLSSPEIPKSAEKTPVAENGVAEHVLTYNGEFDGLQMNGTAKADAHDADCPPNSLAYSHSSSSMLFSKQFEHILEQSTEFEKQIWRRLQVVSDAVATYSDGASEHSCGASTKSVDSASTRRQKEPANSAQTNDENRKQDRVECGEMLLASGEVVDLTVHIFTKDGEKFYKMYRVYINHNYGNGSIRYFLLTNSAMYILRLLDRNDDVPFAKYEREFVLPYSGIDYISVGVNGQLFSIQTIQRKQPMITVCTCSELLTTSILSQAEYASHRFHNTTGDDKKHSLGILTDATPQKIVLTKWLSGELGKVEPSIFRYSLLYWNPSGANQRRESVDDTSGTTGRSGYLYVRLSYPNAWIKKATEWKQSYFMLRGKKLYQFEDSTCKVGERVYDLTSEIVACRQLQTHEYNYSIELLLADGNDYQVHLGCQTKHDMQQWLYAFVASFSRPESSDLPCECLSCCAVVTDGYLILGQESSTLGFTRTLATVTLGDITVCQSCPTHCALLLEFAPSNEHAQQRWVLSFSCTDEMQKFSSCLEKQELLVSEIVGGCDMLSPVCAESFRHWSNGN